MKYTNLFLMTVLSFITMFILMYIMVDRFTNVYPNLNQVYMAGAMAMPMLIIELIFMSAMYRNRVLNMLIMLASIAACALFILFVRRQTAITDREFLKSMIPHHAAALLMCEKAKLKDPELQKLCKNILSTQQAEIDFMKSKLAKAKK